MTARSILLALALCALATSAVPHSGGTNADGCHTNRSTGDYHCHGSRVPAPGRGERYCHVIHGERRCGYARGTCQDLASRFGGYCQRE